MRLQNHANDFLALVNIHLTSLNMSFGLNRRLHVYVSFRQCAHQRQNGAKRNLIKFRSNQFSQSSKNAFFSFGKNFVFVMNYYGICITAFNAVGRILNGANINQRERCTSYSIQNTSYTFVHTVSEEAPPLPPPPPGKRNGEIQREREKSYAGGKLKPITCGASCILRSN